MLFIYSFILEPSLRLSPLTLGTKWVLNLLSNRFVTIHIHHCVFTVLISYKLTMIKLTFSTTISGSQEKSALELSQSFRPVCVNKLVLIYIVDADEMGESAWWREFDTLRLSVLPFFLWANYSVAALVKLCPVWWARGAKSTYDQQITHNKDDVSHSECLVQHLVHIQWNKPFIRENWILQIKYVLPPIEDANYAKHLGGGSSNLSRPPMS